MIRAALAQGESDAPLTVIDCPPGSACPVLESAQAADRCLLVAEPTAFGLHNLDMVYPAGHSAGQTLRRGHQQGNGAVCAAGGLLPGPESAHPGPDPLPGPVGAANRPRRNRLRNGSGSLPAVFRTVESNCGVVRMKRLLILSGKGGTGKTTTAAAFAAFSNTRAAADCDVDAPNLHLILQPDPRRSPRPFGAARKQRLIRPCVPAAAPVPRPAGFTPSPGRTMLSRSWTMPVKAAVYAP